MGPPPTSGTAAFWGMARGEMTHGQLSIACIACIENLFVSPFRVTFNHASSMAR